MKFLTAAVLSVLTLAGCRNATVVRPPAVPTSFALSGQVRDLDGRTVSFARIHAEPLAPFEGWPDTRHATWTSADVTGRYGFGALPPGDWAISCSIDGAVRAPAGIIESPAVSTFDVVLPVGPHIEGTVVDDVTGVPLAGARVLVFDLGDQLVARPKTGPDGRFSVLLHRRDVWIWRFHLDAPGYADVPVGADPDMQESTGESERLAFGLRAVRGTRLHGVVTGPAGPVEGATVTVWHQGLDTDTVDRTLTTDAAGRYELPHLSEGDVTVFVRAPGLVQAETHELEFVGADADGSHFPWHAPEECRVTIGVAGDAVHDVTLVPDEPWPVCTVEGRVLADEDGTPLEGATIRSYYHDFDDDDADGVAATTGPDGSFSASGLPYEAGGVQVLANHPLTWGFGTGLDVPPGGRVSGAEIRLTRFPRVRGRVTTEDGRPAADVRVVVVSADTPGVVAFGAGPSGPSYTTYETRTAADGTYSLAYGRRGTLRVRAVVPGLPPADFVRDEDEGRADLTADLVIAPRPALTGRVVRRHADGGIGGVNVAIVPELWDADAYISDDDVESAVVRAVTAPDGSFRIADLPAGRWMLLAGGGSWTVTTAPADASLREPLVVEVELAFEIGGSVAFADGRSAPGVELTLFPRHPDECVGTDSIDMPCDTGLDGRFLFRGLPAGRYWLEARKGTPEVDELIVGPIDAGTRSLDLRVVPR